MKTKWIGIPVIMLIFVTACNNEPKTGRAGMDMDKDIMQQKKESVIYTCPMHHQIRSDKPGKCPICGMTLVPLKPGNQKTSDTARFITLSARQRFLGNIQTDTARLASLSNQLVLTGTTIFDPRSVNVISAWVSGWIEKMYVRNPGEKVKAGQKLYELYSPDLLSAEKDYLLALQQRDLFKKASVDLIATIEAMKQKLLRWGLSESQIKQLPHQQPSGKVTIYSKTSGYLTQKMKEEGDYVNEGDVVLNVARNNTLWVQAQLYDKELPLLQNQQEIKVELKAFSGKKLSGKIVFNNPVNKEQSRVHLLNITIPNPNGEIQPGMLAYVYLNTSKEQPAVVIPESSVIYGEKNNYVWVERQDNDSAVADKPASTGKFERREVQLGTDNNTNVQILQGVKAGELVVTSGAYLVNSEYILKYGSGVNLSGMQMSDMQMKGRSK